MSGFSTEWDKAYRAGSHLSRWPWSDVVSLTIKTLGGDLRGRRILEIGCGYGANVPFFLALNADFYGVDGSETAVVSLRERFPQLRDRLAVCDFTKTLAFNETFDLIVDRAAVTHNSTEGIQSTLRLVRERLKPGGVYMGVDWFADDNSYVRGGTRVDEFTRSGFTEGPYTGVGVVHFSSESHLQDLFKGYNLFYLEKKHTSMAIPADGVVYSAWNLLAK